MRRVALLCALALYFSAPLLAQVAPGSLPAAPLPTSEQKLLRLQAIFSQLEAISLQLEAKLETSEENLARLSDELRTLKLELADIGQKLTLSEEQSARLEAMLAKSEALLAKASESFASYRRQVATELWITRAAAVVGVAFGVYGLLRAAQ